MTDVNCKNSIYSAHTEVNWDADNGDSSKFLADGNLKVDGNIESALKLKYPGRVISTTFRKATDGDKNALSGEVSWAPKKAVSFDTKYTFVSGYYDHMLVGNAALKTPFNGFERLAANLNHKLQNEVYSTSADLEWAVNRKIEASNSLRKINGWNSIENAMTISTPWKTVNLQIKRDGTNHIIEAAWDQEKVILNVNGQHTSVPQKTVYVGNFDLTTTFPELSKLAFRTTNNIEDNEIRSHIEGQYLNKKMELDLYGKSNVNNRMSDLEGSIQMKSPFRYIEDIGMSLSHSSDGRTFNTNGEMKWAGNEKITMASKMSNVLTGSNMLNEGRTTFTTPFRGYRKMSAAWHHQSTAETLNSNLDLELEHEKISLNLEGMHTKDYYGNRKVNGKVDIKTPIKNIFVSFNHECGMQNFKTEASLSYDPSSKIDVGMEFNAYKKYDGSFHLRTPFIYMEDVSGALHLTTHGEPKIGHIHFQWMPSKQIALDSEFTIRGLALTKGELRLTSPFEKFEKLVFSIDHRKSGAEFVSNFGLEYANKRKITLSTKVQTEGQTVLSMRLNSLCPWLKVFYIYMEHQGVLTNFRNTVDMEYQGMHKIAYHNTLTLQSYRYINGNVKFTSPISNMENIALDVRHEKQNSIWTTDIDMQLEPRRKITLNSKIGLENGVEISTKVKTPFYELNSMEVDVFHRGGIANFDSKIDINAMTRYQKSIVAGTLKMAGFRNINGEITINTPFTEEMSAKIIQTLIQQQWMTIAGAQYGTKRVDLDAKLQTSGPIKGELLIKTPLDGWKNFKADFEHSGDLNNFEMVYNVNYEPFRGQLSARVTGKNTDSYKMWESTIITPFRGYEKLQANIEHRTTGYKAYKSSASLSYPYEKVIQVISELNVPSINNFDVKLHLNTPFRSIQTGNLAYKHNGVNNGFDCHLEMQYNNEKKQQLDLNFKNERTLFGQIQLDTSYPNIEKIRLMGTHTGRLADFSTHVEFEYYDDKIQADAQFSSIRDVEGKLKVTTPYEKYEALSVEFKHEGEMKSFRSSAKAANGREHVIQFDVSLDTDDRIEASLDFKKKYYNENTIKLNLKHEGNLRQFQTHGGLTLSKNENFVFDASLNTNEQIRGNIKVTTPKTVIGLDINHQGSFFSKCETTASAIFDEKKIEFTSKFVLEPSLSGYAKLTSPFLPELNLEFGHRGNMESMSSNAVFSYGRDKTFKASADFRRYPLDLKITLDTPFDQIKDIQLNINHKGNMQSSMSHVSFTYATGKTIEINSNVKTSPVYLADMTFNSPFEPVRNLHLSINSKCDYRGNHCTGNMVFEFGNSQSINLQSEFQQTPAKLSINLQSPYKYFEDIKLMLSHSGNMQSFASHAEFSYQEGKTIAIDAEYSSTPNAAATVVFKSPFEAIEHLKAEVKYQGSPSDFESSVKFTYGYDAVYQSIVAYRMSPFKAAVSFKSPIRNWEDVSLNMDANSGFHADLQYPSGQIKVQLSTTPKVRGSVEVKTPYENYENMKLTVEHDMDSSSLSTKSKFTYGKDQRISASLEAKNSPKYQLVLDVQTPFEGFENVVLSSETRLRKKVFITSTALQYGNKQKIAFECNYKNYDQIIGKCSLTTPMENFEDIAITFKHNGDVNEFQANGRLEYGKENFNGNVEFKRSPFTLKAGITSPIKHLENIVVELEGRALPGSYSTSGKLVYAPGKKVEFDGKLNTGENMANGAFGFKTPFYYYEDIQTSFNIQGDKSNMKGHAEFTYAPEKTLEVSFEHRKAYSFFEKLSVKTPYSNYEQMGLEVSYTGNMNDFQSDVKVEYQPRKIIHALYTVKNRNGNIEVLGQVTSPIRHYELFSVNINHNGNLNQFKTNGILTYNTNKIQLEATYQQNANVPRLASLTLLTPFRNFEHIAIDFINKKNGDTYETSGEFRWSPNHKIKLSTNIKDTWSLNNIEGGVELNTPFQVVRNFVIDVKHGYGRNLANTKVKINYNGRNVVEGDFNYINNNGRHQAEINMQEPISLTSRFDLLKNDGELDSNLAVNWNKRNVRINVGSKDTSTAYRTKKDTSIRINIPGRNVGLTSNWLKSKTDFQHSSELVWDTEKQKKISYSVNFNDRSRNSQTSYDLKTRLYTPIRTVEVTMSRTKEPNNCVSLVEMLYDAARDVSKKVSLKAEYGRSQDVHNTQLTLSLPKMQKDIVLRNEVTMKTYPKTLASKTQLEYSSDPRDTITITHKLLQAPVREGFNYSYEFGMEQPRSSMDMLLKTHIGNTPESASLHWDLAYQTARRQNQNMALWAQIHKIKNTVALQMLTPLKIIEINGQMETRGDTHIFTLKNVYDRIKHVSTVAAIDPIRRSADLKVHYSTENPEDMLHVYGKYMSPTNLKFEAYRMHDGRRITEGLLDLDLKAKHLLHTKIYWRPSMYFELKDKWARMQSRSSRGSDNSFLKQALDDEVNARTLLFKRNSPNFAPVASVFAEEVDVLKEDYQQMKTTYDQMYYDNEFFLQDLNEMYMVVARMASEKIEILRKAVEEKMVRISQRVDELKEIIREYSTKMAAMLDDLKFKYEEFKPVVMEKIAMGKNYMNYQLNKMETKLTEIAEITSLVVSRAMEGFTQKLSPFIDAYYRLYDYLTLKGNKLSEMTWNNYNNMAQKIREHPKWQMATNTLGMATEKMNAITDVVKFHSKRLSNTITEVDLMKPMRDVQVNVIGKVRRMNRMLTEASQNLAEKYNTVFEEVQNRVNAYILNVLDHQSSKYVRTALSEVYHQGLWLYNALDVENNLRLLLINTVTSTADALKENSLYIVNEYLHLDQDKLIVWDPRNGNIEFEVYIPMEWPHLEALPIEETKSMLKKISRRVSNYIPQSDYSPWDTFYNYKPTGDVLNWIPPFKASASLLGNQHYLTFDGRYYEFAGQCSYILARDFGTKQFTVVVNYENGEKKSIAVTTNGKTIEITTDNKVTVDGRQSELPIRMDDVSILRLNNVVTVESTKGYRVEYDNVQDLTTVQISGWYFGKVAGLFGTYNNEPSDDFTTSENKKVSDINEFTSSWLSSRACRRSRNLVGPYPDEDIESVKGKKCGYLFKCPKSPFRPCFKQVNPDRFYKMCLHSADDQSGKYRGVCHVASFYVEVCKRQGVKLKEPAGCVRCEREGHEDFTEDQPIEVRDTTIPSADIVFVVEEKRCNKDAYKKLDDIAVELELALRNKGVKNNRYGLVGFGGQGVHDPPHQHTIDGNLMDTARKFGRLGLKALVFDDGSNTDVLRAINFAANYPFRPDSIKQIITLTCSKCEPIEIDMNKVLLEREITLHMLKEQEFLLKGQSSSPKSSTLFGIDSDGAFLKKHVTDKKLDGDKELFQHISRPADTCTSLALRSGGTFFNIGQVTDSRVNFQKHFIDIFSRRVAKSAESPECQVCQCMPDSTGNGVSVCKTCDLNASSSILPRK